MQRADVLAARYRVILDRADDHLFVATCAELPELCGRGFNVEAAMDGLRGALVANLPRLAAAGEAPTPIRDFEGPLGAWAADLQIIDVPAPAVGAAAGLQKPVPSALRAIAQWTVERYRMVLEAGDDADATGWVANCFEMPAWFGRGATPGAAVADLRDQLAEEVFALLDGGAMPPEPLRDVEARESGCGGRARPVARVA